MRIQFSLFFLPFACNMENAQKRAPGLAAQTQRGGQKKVVIDLLSTIS
jgi:hypothetical protein